MERLNDVDRGVVARRDCAVSVQNRTIGRLSNVLADVPSNLRLVRSDR